MTDQRTDHERRFARLYPMFHGDHRRYSAAIPELQSLHAEGYVPATDVLSQAYVEGQGVRRDHARGAALAREAADRGSVSSQARLGTMYRLGQGVPADLDEAATWYRRAAAQGSGAAAYNLTTLLRSSDAADPADEWLWHAASLDQQRPAPAWRPGSERRMLELEEQLPAARLSEARQRLERIRQGYRPLEERDTFWLWKCLHVELGDR